MCFFISRTSSSYRDSCQSERSRGQSFTKIERAFDFETLVSQVLRLTPSSLFYLFLKLWIIIVMRRRDFLVYEITVNHFQDATLSQSRYLKKPFNLSQISRLFQNGLSGAN